jgi:cytochrome b involved in lipid metabolism
MEKPISGKVVAQHNSRESCWIIVHGVYIRNAEVTTLIVFPGKVYDVTEFLDGILSPELTSIYFVHTHSFMASS